MDARIRILLAFFCTIAFVNIGHAGKDEKIQFSSAPMVVTAFHLKRAKALRTTIEKHIPLLLDGSIIFPDKEPPYAVVILLHGCFANRQWRENWQLRLVQWGFAVLSFDAFLPRHIKDTCNDRYSVSPWSRALDVLGAVELLSKRNDINPNSIGAIGLTHGAWSLFYTLTSNNVKAKNKLAAAVALYPICGPYSEFNAPVWVLFADQRKFGNGFLCDESLQRVKSKHEITIETSFEIQSLNDELETKGVITDNLTKIKPDLDQQMVIKIHRFLNKHLNE